MYELSSDFKSRKRIKDDNKNNGDKWSFIFSGSIRKKSIFIFKILLIMVASVLLIMLFQFESISSSEPELVEVEVVKGDNLWKIADRHYGDNIDLRKKIFKIKKVNELESAMLTPGQKILIPIYK